MRAGDVIWIGLRPGRRQSLVSVPFADLVPSAGLVGDHGQSPNRQVTLIQVEHLAAIAAHLGRVAIDPSLLRRNIVVRGINLHAMKNRCFRVGTALLQTTGECHPCSRMEENLGSGGYNAVRGHGGITARIVTAGRVMLGDPIARSDHSALDPFIKPALP